MTMTTENYCTVGPFECEPPEKRWNVQRNTWNARKELTGMSRVFECATQDEALRKAESLNREAFRAGRHRAPKLCCKCGVGLYRPMLAASEDERCIGCADPSAEVENLDRFEVQATDPAGDPELVCLDCGAVLCNVEIGDSLAVLVGCAEEHARSKHRRRSAKCRPSDEEQDAARAETGED